jgi:acyl-CoA thioester hydrolase
MTTEDDAAVARRAQRGSDRGAPRSPASPEFRLDVVASTDDIDEQGHVSNVVFVRWVQDVAMAHSVAAGWDHAAYLRFGAIFVVHRHEVDYLRPVKAGERVGLITCVAWWRAATCERRTRVVRVRDGEVLARAVTLWALISVDGGRPLRIPRDLAEAFARVPTSRCAG